MHYFHNNIIKSFNIIRLSNKVRELYIIIVKKQTEILWAISPPTRRYWVVWRWRNSKRINFPDRNSLSFVRDANAKSFYYNRKMVLIENVIYKRHWEWLSNSRLLYWQLWLICSYYYLYIYISHMYIYIILQLANSQYRERNKQSFWKCLLGNDIAVG